MRASSDVMVRQCRVFESFGLVGRLYVYLVLDIAEARRGAT